MAQLLGETVRDDIDGLVEIVAVILRMDIRPGDGKVDFDDESVLERALVIVPESDVGSDKAQTEMFQVSDFLRDVGVNGGSQFNITGADMDLHILKLHSAWSAVHGRSWCLEQFLDLRIELRDDLRGARAQVARRQPAGSWLRLLDQPEFSPVTR